MRVPTDYAILNDIYDHYYRQFANFPADAPAREAKIYVPLDIRSIAKRLGVDPDIIFGRLYYHLEEKHGYRRETGVHVAFFSRAVGEDRDCINFPLLGAVLAGLREERRKDRWAIGIAVVSLIVSVVSVAISLGSKAANVG